MRYAQGKLIKKSKELQRMAEEFHAEAVLKRNRNYKIAGAVAVVLILILCIL